MAGLNGVKHELSQEQLQSLADEINNDARYTEKHPHEIEKLLNEHALIPNPIAVKKVNAPNKTLAEIVCGAGWSSGELAAIQANAEGAEILKILTAGVDLNDATLVSYLERLQALSLLPSDKIQATTALGKIDDPNWQAQIPGQSQVEVALGDGYTVEGADVKAALS